MSNTHREAPETDVPAKPARDEDGEAYLVEVGQRVRHMRAIRGMSRKVLAQTSGVSERYIAQLEGGLGNISIMLLRRVAAATGAPIEDLVADPRRRPESWPLIRDLLRDAAPATVEAVKAVLQGKTGAPPVAEPAPVERVALIGLRGAGKSTIGSRAAQALGWPFIELDKEIERETGLSLTEIFAMYGQEGFKRLELGTLRHVIDRPGPMIVAAGGGIVAEAVTYDALRHAFFTIWLRARPAEHMQRVRRQGDLRPMRNDSAAMAELITILSSREPLYAMAQRVLDTSGAEPERCVERLIEIIRAG